MYKEIVVNVNQDETRVGVLEDQVLVELYIERSVNQRLVGNIYRGRVENVLPGMQAAFVNIGLERNAFLYVDEALPPRQPAEHGFAEDAPRPQFSLPRANISDVVKEGQTLVVQVTKEQVGTKGPRVTTHLTLPGRYLVLMPGVDYVGISRRIEDEEERNRLRGIADRLRGPEMGVIVRTVAEGMEEHELEQDLTFLTRVWKKTLSKSVTGQVPSLIHQDLDLVQRILRDVFTADVDRLVIDSREARDKVLELLDFIGPQLKSKVKLEEPDQIKQQYSLGQEIEKAMKRKVWLKCGGYLVFDQTEALTVIDVNTGKYVGTNDLEDTVVKTNLEAAVEIARQIRLRNIGGIIIVDFIDMIDEAHQQEVLAALEAETKKDKIKTNILGITKLGLVEITRKKVGQTLSTLIQRACPYCDGKGKVLSEETVSLQVKQELFEVSERCSGEAILVEVHPGVAALLIGNGGSGLRELEHSLKKELLIRGHQELHIEQYNLQVMANREELEKNLPVRLDQVLEITVEEPHGSSPYDGIARYNGYVINIEGAGHLIGERVRVEVNKVQRTSARARLLE